MTRWLAVAALVLCATPALAQTPGQAPQEGYGLHDVRDVGPFTIERWVSAARSEISGAGMCDCLTVVYEGSRHLITFGTPGTLAAYTLADLTGTDVNGDGLPDVLITEEGTECHGMTGQGYSLVSKQPNGSWKEMSGGTGVPMFLATKGAAGRPDLQVGGPGFCFPVLRWNGRDYALQRHEYEGKRCKPQR